MMRSQTHPAQPDTGELNLIFTLQTYHLSALANESRSELINVQTEHSTKCYWKWVYFYCSPDKSSTHSTSHIPTFHPASHMNVIGAGIRALIMIESCDTRAMSVFHALHRRILISYIIFEKMNTESGRINTMRRPILNRGKMSTCRRMSDVCEEKLFRPKQRFKFDDILNSLQRHFLNEILPECRNI